MPELYARYLQQPNAPWIDAAHALNDVSQDLFAAAFQRRAVRRGTRDAVQEPAEAPGVSRSTRGKEQRAAGVFSPQRSRSTWWNRRGFDAALMQALAGIVIALPPHA